MKGVTVRVRRTTGLLWTRSVRWLQVGQLLLKRKSFIRMGLDWALAS